MKLSDINEEKKKKNQPEKVSDEKTRDIMKILEEEGISEDDLLSAAMELYVPHPGVENRDIAERVFHRELILAVSDPNLSILIYAGILLEKEGSRGNLPGMKKETFKKDLTFLIVDEVIGMSIAKYISGHKGIFEYVRFDKLKPGLLSSLGPFMDDVIAGLIGGVSANMYSRGKDDGGKIEIPDKTEEKPGKKLLPRKVSKGFAG